MPSSALRLSIIIPVYKEEYRLPETLRANNRYLATQLFDGEVLVVDDGSTDATVAVTRGYPGVAVLTGPHRRKGFAVRAGVLASEGEFVLFCDADLAVPIEEWTNPYRQLINGYDVAIGSREGLGASRLGEPWYRHVMGRVFNLLVRGMAVRGIRDTQCGFKALRREVAVDLFQRMRVYRADANAPRGPAVTGYDVELLYLAQRQCYRIREVPVAWRYGSETKVKVFHDTVRNLRDVSLVRLNAWRHQYDDPPRTIADQWDTAQSAAGRRPRRSAEIDRP